MRRRICTASRSLVRLPSSLIRLRSAVRSAACAASRASEAARAMRRSSSCWVSRFSRACFLLVPEMRLLLRATAAMAGGETWLRRGTKGPGSSAKAATSKTCAPMGCEHGLSS